MDHRQVKAMKVVLLVSSIVSLGVLALSASEENFSGAWRDAQADYQVLLLETADGELARQAAKAFRVEHKQIYLPELARVDRCTTCHLGVENPAMAEVPQPIRRHSGDLLRFHPPDKFGCTICHQGQGQATVKDFAHGWRPDGAPVPFMDSPMLRGDAVYTSCGRCHDELDLYGGAEDLFARNEEGDGASAKPMIDEGVLSASLPGADRLAAAKKLVVQSGCLGCHQYRGRGGTLGPDLTYVGDKTRHDFDFTHIEGEHTVEQWLFEHFKYPRRVSPTTVMPDMGLTDDQARDLALYMGAFHRKDAPASHMPEPAALASSRVPVRGETLYKMYCSACHGPDGYGSTMRQGLWQSDADPWGRSWDARNIVIEQRSDMEVLTPSLNLGDTLAVASDDYLRRVVTYGRPGTKMLAWAEEGGLSGDEITLLVQYLRSWQEPPPDMAAVSSARGDVRVGGALYRSNCAGCHGAAGQGGIGVTLNSPTFLAVASDAFLRDTIVYGRPNTAMPAWRGFDAQEVSDLLAYLRQWQTVRSDVPSVVATVSQEDSARASVRIGRVLYKANCVMCHGLDGSGDLAPSLRTQAFLTAVSDVYLAETMIQGRPGTGMPSWRHLSNDDVASLIKYVRTWQTEPSHDAEWHAQVVPRGDWDTGRRIFTGHCSGCHGVDGEGASGPQLNNPVFLANASDVMLREWITNGKEGTEMRGFRKGGQGIGELSERHIDDVVAYLRYLERAGENEIARVAKSPHGRPETGVHIYAANCSGCHGVYGEGASGPALANANFLRFASDGFLMATMALGRRGTEMRPVKRGPQSILGLSSDEVNDLVAFLRSWEYAPPELPGAVADVPHRFVVPWDLGRGHELYLSNCSGCHGEEGKGLWAPELNNEGFLASATDGFLQATIVRGRRGTAMRAFGRGSNGLGALSSEDVDDIVAYIRHWSTLAPSPMTLPAERSLDAPMSSERVTQIERIGAARTVSAKGLSGFDSKRAGNSEPMAAWVPPLGE